MAKQNSGLTKRQLEALEKLYAREIDSALTDCPRPFQSKAKVYKELEAEGCAQFVEELMRFKDGLPPMTIEGWVLTELGRLLYCQSCAEVTDGDAE